MTTRKKYTKEFKLDAVSLVVEQGYSRADAARSLEIDPSLVRRWVKEHQAEDDQAFRGNGKLTTMIRKTVAYESNPDFVLWRRQINLITGVGGFGPLIDESLK